MLTTSRSLCAVNMGDAPLPEYLRRAIYGEMSLEEKRAALDKSTNNWWKEYAARKNDEEEEHVADTLLYDERCHLPRMAPRPDVVPADAHTIPNFIDSAFRTRVEYDAAARLAPAEFAAAEASARAAFSRAQ